MNNSTEMSPKTLAAFLEFKVSLAGAGFATVDNGEPDVDKPITMTREKVTVTMAPSGNVIISRKGSQCDQRAKFEDCRAIHLQAALHVVSLFVALN